MKVKQYEKVLAVIADAVPDSISKDEMAVQLEDSGVEFYRLPTYIWEIKHKAGVPLETIKSGRKVVGYRIAVVASDSDVETDVVLSANKEEDTVTEHDAVGDTATTVAAVK